MIIIWLYVDPEITNINANRLFMFQLTHDGCYYYYIFFFTSDSVSSQYDIADYEIIF